ncbi:hypothetical protein [Bradyrhizobium sp.]|uniref:hypothetical protein n=1 Tax=Bradyrhizobium sp. TaxID=376 RepID=UPI00239A264B|nr:hypothetical protein [Bradyrhizobium sp.]MDE1935431.1 hypothetical protein [Bradyrhizobium sp.]MDE2062873.1 hypothetical protein [Bradyrhizobium sp.]
MMEYWMYGYGPVHWVWLIVMIAVVIYPVSRILGRIGFSPLWSILMFIPLVNLVALWIVAFADWPGRRQE